MKFWGVYKFLVGTIAAADSLFGMMQSVNGSRETLWGPAALATSILLAIEGLGQLFPRLHRFVLIALAAAVPLAISSRSAEWHPRIWICAIVLAFLEWMFQSIKQGTGRPDIGALAFASVLAAALANTTFELFRFYWNEPSFWPLSQIFRFMSPIALPWTLVLVLLAHAGREVAGGLRQEASAQPEA